MHADLPANPNEMKARTALKTHDLEQAQRSRNPNFANLYTRYHAQNFNKFKCLLPEAFHRFIGPSIPTELNDSDLGNIKDSMFSIIDQVVLFRDYETPMWIEKSRDSLKGRINPDTNEPYDDDTWLVT